MRVTISSGQTYPIAVYLEASSQPLPDNMAHDGK